MASGELRRDCLRDPGGAIHDGGCEVRVRLPLPARNTTASRASLPWAPSSPEGPSAEYDWIILAVNPATLAIQGLVTVDSQGGPRRFLTNLKENIGLADNEFTFKMLACRCCQQLTSPYDVALLNLPGQHARVAGERLRLVRGVPFMDATPSCSRLRPRRRRVHQSHSPSPGDTDTRLALERAKIPRLAGSLRQKHVASRVSASSMMPS